MGGRGGSSGGLSPPCSDELLPDDTGVVELVLGFILSISSAGFTLDMANTVVVLLCIQLGYFQIFC